MTNIYPVMCSLEHYICAVIVASEPIEAIQEKIDRMKFELNENGESVFSDDLEDLCTDNGWLLNWIGGDDTMIMW